MSRDDEIIELGEDGTFDITTTVSVKQATTEQIDYNTYDWSRVENLDKLELVKELLPNEYAVYQKENGKVLWVILMLAEGDKLKEVVYRKNRLHVMLASDQKFDVELPENCNIEPTSIRCKCCKQMVTLVMETSPKQ
jgi:hypothetical protein